MRTILLSGRWDRDLPNTLRSWDLFPLLWRYKRLCDRTFVSRNFIFACCRCVDDDTDHDAFHDSCLIFVSEIFKLPVGTGGFGQTEYGRFPGLHRFKLRLSVVRLFLTSVLLYTLYTGLFAGLPLYLRRRRTTYGLKINRSR